ncbi:hypothetical protein ES708_18692 [subsurface metagenome]
MLLISQKNKKNETKQKNILYFLKVRIWHKNKKINRIAYNKNMLYIIFVC